MLYLIRHAQASYLSKDYDQLSLLGQQQAQALGGYLADNVNINHKYVGPHKRQIQTAKYIQDAYSQIEKFVPTPTLVPSLKEHSGPATLAHLKVNLINQDPQCMRWHQESLKKPSQLRENSIKIFEYFIPKWMSGKYAVNGIETYAAFRQQIATEFNHLLDHYDTASATAIVTSAGTISTILAHLLAIEEVNTIAKYSLDVYNASITSLSLSQGKWQLENFNQVDHLADHMKTVV